MNENHVYQTEWEEILSNGFSPHRAVALRQRAVRRRAGQTPSVATAAWLHLQSAPSGLPTAPQRATATVTAVTQSIRALVRTQAMSARTAQVCHRATIFMLALSALPDRKYAQTMNITTDGTDQRERLCAR